MYLHITDFYLSIHLLFIDLVENMSIVIYISTIISLLLERPVSQTIYNCSVPGSLATLFF